MHLNEQLNVYRTFLIISFKYVYYEVDKSTDSLYQANTGYCVAKIWQFTLYNMLVYSVTTQANIIVRYIYVQILNESQNKNNKRLNMIMQTGYRITKQHIS